MHHNFLSHPTYRLGAKLIPTLGHLLMCLPREDVLCTDEQSKSAPYLASGNWSCDAVDANWVEGYVVSLPRVESIKQM